MSSVQAVLLAVACFIATSLSAPLTPIHLSPYVGFQSLYNVPSPWIYQQPAPPNHILNLRIGLKVHNVEDFHQRVFDISTPGHPSYGLHMNQDEVNAMLNPSDESAFLVLEWLESFGIIGVHENQWIKADATVAQAQELLQTQYNVYLNPLNSRTIIRTTSYSLPSVMFEHVDLIQPTTTFGMEPRVSRIEQRPASSIEKRAAPPASCARTITPACIGALYNTTNYVPKSTDINRIGIAGFHNEFANRADLQTFYSKFRPDAVGASYTTFQVNGGGDDQSKPGAEANLDVQYASGVAFPTPVIYYSVGGEPPFIPDEFTPTNTNEPFLEFLNFILNQESIPQTLIIAYGDDEQTVPQDYATRVCNIFAQLGSQGTTVLVLSGDGGVGGGSCKTNDGTNRVLFQPTFPASCPFVTSVGGTKHVTPEVAADFSGGGFSRYFPRPPYQTTAVNGYLAGLGSTYGGLFDSKGRGYPDVAAQSEGFQVVVGGQVQTFSGTSASVVAFGAVVSLLNDFRLSQGKPTLGFLNPLLYSNLASGFNDITLGSNPGCLTNGFTAGKGWDPVTGLGTPDFLKLKTLV